MSKFRVGDPVRVTDHASIYFDRVATIEGYCSSPGWYQISIGLTTTITPESMLILADAERES